MENKLEVTRMHTYYPHNDSAIAYFLVSGVESKKQIMKEIKNANSNNYDDDSILDEYLHHCNCSYDCCGHWNSSMIHFCSFDEIYNTAIVSISYSQNV